MITIDDFHAIDIRIGTIRAAEKVPGSEKLLKLSVEFGMRESVSIDGEPREPELRTIVSGIAKYFESPDLLIGKQCPFIYNLEPRMIMGIESNGMIVAAGDESTVAVLHPDRPVASGSKIR